MADLNSAGVEAAAVAAMIDNGCGITLEGKHVLCDSPGGLEKPGDCSCRSMARAAITAYLTALPTTPEAGAAGVEAVAWVNPKSLAPGMSIYLNPSCSVYYSLPLYPASALTAMQEQIDALTEECRLSMHTIAEERARAEAAERCVAEPVWTPHDGKGDPDIPGDTVVMVKFRDNDTGVGVMHDWDQNWQWEGRAEDSGHILAYRQLEPEFQRYCEEEVIRRQMLIEAVAALGAKGIAVLIAAQDAARAALKDGGQG